MREIMTFGDAIVELQGGHKVAREGWNGKGMWLILVPAIRGVHPKMGERYHGAGLTGPITIDPHIDMWTTRGTMQPGWQPTQSDTLANDWRIV